MFPVGVTPLAMQQYLLLQRNLVYTSITQGKKLVVLIGQRKAMGMAVQINRIDYGFSGLLARLSTGLLLSTLTSATAAASMLPQAWQRQ